MVVEVIRFLGIFAHEFGHYVAFRVLGYHPLVIWVGHCPTKQEIKEGLANIPGGRNFFGLWAVWFPWEEGYNGGGKVFCSPKTRFHKIVVYPLGFLIHLLFYIVVAGVFCATFTGLGGVVGYLTAVRFIPHIPPSMLCVMGGGSILAFLTIAIVISRWIAVDSLNGSQEDFQNLGRCLKR